MAECMNKWFGEARYLDPVRLFRAYTLKLNRMFEKRRMMYSAIENDDVPKRDTAMIKDGLKDGSTMRVARHTQDIFEDQPKTDPEMTRVVNLAQISCSCGFFNKHGVPCRHICAAAMSVDIHPNVFVVPERRVGSLKRMYEGVVIPIDVSHLNSDETRPPTQTKKRGRPREKRIPSAAEKMSKKTVKCGRCGRRGHNARTCKWITPNGN